MIGFSGLSHLGIVTSIAAAEKGFDVLGFDPDVTCTADLSAGRLKIHEVGLPALIESNRSKLKFTSSSTELSVCDVVYISCDVATDSENRSDTGPLVELARITVANMREGSTLVVLSQVNPGFTRSLGNILSDTLKMKRISLYYQVETLIFGRAVERALYPERHMIGCENPVGELPALMKTYLDSFKCPCFKMRYESAELAKIAINFFLVASVTTSNTLAELCEKIGADWSEIIPTLRLDARIGPHAYLTPGLGIAGGNLERDLATYMQLAARLGVDDQLPRTFLSHSQHRKTWVLKTLHEHVLSRVSSPRIAIWGLAYKPNTKFVKNAPSLELISALRGIDIQLYDPEARLEHILPGVKETDSPEEAVRGAHVLVIMTAWDQFKRIRPGTILPLLSESLRPPLVIDPAAAWAASEVLKEGARYITLGAHG